MGDLITVRCVLKRQGYKGIEGKCDGLAFVNPAQHDNPWHWIPCRELGQPILPGLHAQWEYEVRGDRLHFTPSLLDTSDQFHTDYNWSVAFSECPDEKNPHDFFFEVNPDLKT